jgi:hypothetical protein
VLSLQGAQLSSLRLVEGVCEVRVFNPTDEATVVDLDGPRGFEVDLVGRAIQPFEGTLALRPHGIATLRLASGA